jgi:AraC-like DNA-binding protein
MYLEGGDPPETAIEDAAKEHGLVPALLARRFEATTGIAPAGWRTKAQAAYTDLTRAQAAVREGLLHRARMKAYRWGRAGPTFTMRGEEYVYAGRHLDYPWAARAVRVSDCAGCLIEWDEFRDVVEPQLKRKRPSAPDLS